jgi:hypothetical protein
MAADRSIVATNEERSPDFDDRRHEIAAWGFRQYQQLIDDYEEKWKAIREKGR